jgi:hypothetical protein
MIFLHSEAAGEQIVQLYVDEVSLFDAGEGGEVIWRKAAVKS